MVLNHKSSCFSGLGLPSNLYILTIKFDFCQIPLSLVKNTCVIPEARLNLAINSIYSAMAARQQSVWKDLIPGFVVCQT